MAKYPAYIAPLISQPGLIHGRHIGFVELSENELEKIHYGLTVQGENAYYFHGVSVTDLKTGIKEEIMVKIKVSSENDKYDPWRYCEDMEDNIVSGGMLYEYNPTVLSGHQPPFRLYVRRDNQKNIVKHMNEFYEDEQLNHIMKSHITLLNDEKVSVKNFADIFFSVNTGDLFYCIVGDDMNLFKFEKMGETMGSIIVSYWDDLNGCFSEPVEKDKNECFSNYLYTYHIGRVFL